MSREQKRLFAAAGLLLPLLAAGAELALPAESLQVGKRGRVFKSDDGIEVAVVSLEPAESRRALVQITGTTSKHDGKVFLVDIVEWNRNVDYKMQFKGKPYVLITMRSGNYEAHMPDFHRNIPVRYDEKKSEALKPETVLKAYTEQPKSSP